MIISHVLGMYIACCSSESRVRLAVFTIAWSFFLRIANLSQIQGEKEGSGCTLTLSSRITQYVFTLFRYMYI